MCGSYGGQHSSNAEYESVQSKLLCRVHQGSKNIHQHTIARILWHLSWHNALAVHASITIHTPICISQPLAIYGCDSVSQLSLFHDAITDALAHTTKGTYLFLKYVPIKTICSFLPVEFLYDFLFCVTIPFAYASERSTANIVEITATAGTVQ